MDGQPELFDSQPPLHPRKVNHQKTQRVTLQILLLAVTFYLLAIEIFPLGPAAHPEALGFITGAITFLAVIIYVFVKISNYYCHDFLAARYNLFLIAFQISLIFAFGQAHYASKKKDFNHQILMSHGSVMNLEKGFDKSAIDKIDSPEIRDMYSLFAEMNDQISLIFEPVNLSMGCLDFDSIFDPETLVAGGKLDEATGQVRDYVEKTAKLGSEYNLIIKRYKSRFDRLEISNAEFKNGLLSSLERGTDSCGTLGSLVEGHRKISNSLEQYILFVNLNKGAFAYSDEEIDDRIFTELTEHLTKIQDSLLIFEKIMTDAGELSNSFKPGVIMTSHPKELLKYDSK